MVTIDQLLDLLAGELERSRELSSQVIRHISGGYDVERDAVGPFLVERLPRLEDDEVDLVLSPLFTPRLTDQAIVATALGRESVPREKWPEIVRRLAERPVRATLLSDG